PRYTNPPEDIFLTVRFVAPVLVVLLVTVAAASAHPAFSALRGVVSDPQGAVVQAATITVRSRATNASWTATSDKEGRFAIPMVPPGDYDVTARATAALADWHRDTVSVNVGQDRVLEIRMSLAGVRETTVVIENE